MCLITMRLNVNMATNPLEYVTEMIFIERHDANIVPSMMLPLRVGRYFVLCL